ncbi:pentapeptide repeat-containing protein [Streptomyces lavendulae]|uniref:pentapeptide repeat-containing protein n=1 Tax=Streptomyces lavendulae TaxID=1914 RepID=UPI0025544AB5|nr:pentapeptide repeat-containing protein [Streptomyces lavendulae]
MTGWNSWRIENPSVLPDLSGADLSGVDLSGADLSGADLSGADLSGANLIHAKTSLANFTRAKVTNATRMPVLDRTRMASPDTLRFPRDAGVAGGVSDGDRERRRHDVRTDEIPAGVA